MKKERKKARLQKLEELAQKSPDYLYVLQKNYLGSQPKLEAEVKRIAQEIRI